MVITEVSDDGLTIYAAAQCAETVTQSGCQGCLNAAYESINNCFPAAEARLADAACFLRYSFFSDNQTTDITPLLDVGGESSKGKAVVWGVVGGLVILVGFVLWCMQVPEQPQELQRVENNFSDEKKLGEGSFGVVYKLSVKTSVKCARMLLDQGIKAKLIKLVQKDEKGQKSGELIKGGDQAFGGEHWFLEEGHVRLMSWMVLIILLARTTF